MIRFALALCALLYTISACRPNDTPHTTPPPSPEAVADTPAYIRWLDREGTQIEANGDSAQAAALKAWELVQREFSDSIQARMALRLLIRYNTCADSGALYTQLAPRLADWRTRYAFVPTALDLAHYLCQIGGEDRVENPELADSLAARVGSALAASPDWEMEVLFLHRRVLEYQTRNFAASRQLAKRLDTLLETGVDTWLAGKRVGLVHWQDLYFAYRILKISDQRAADHERANLQIERSAAILQRVGVRDSLLLYDMELARFNLASYKRDYAKALEISEQALHYLPQGNKSNLSRTRMSRSGYWGKLGQQRKSLNEIQLGLAAAYEIIEPNDRQGLLAMGYRRLVGVHLALDDTTSAAQALDSLDYYAPGSDEALNALAMRAQFYTKTQRYRQSLQTYEQLFGVYSKIYGTRKPQLSNLYAELSEQHSALGEMPLALAYAQRALACTAPEFVDTLDVRKNPTFEQIAHKNEALTALRAKVQALQRVDSVGFLAVRVEAAELAVQCLEAMIQTFERENSKKEFIREAFAVYEMGIEAAFAQYQASQKLEYLERAFALAERSKSILLHQALQEENAAQFAGIPDSLIRAEKQLEIDIAFYQQELQKAQNSQNAEKQAIAETYLAQFRTRLDALKKSLERDFPKYYALKYQTAAQVSLADVQARLDSTTVLIEVFEGERFVYFFSVEQQRVQLHAYARTDDYSRDLRTYRYALSSTEHLRDQPDASYQTLTQTGWSIYKKYLAASIPAQAKHLRFVPDGLWNYIPLEALPVRENWAQATDFKTIPYLVQNLTVNYDYAAGLWLERLQKPSEVVNGRVLAFAPTYQLDSSTQQSSVRRALNPLVATQDEVKFLEPHFAGAFYFGADANEATLKAQASQFGILHFAMHGLVDDVNPQFSGLAFTEVPGNEDNILQAYEIKALDLRASLVVLSACETGIGQYQHGEGVMSLGRSFMYAGAPSVVMTLWSVNDRTSQALVQLFYQHLADGLDKDAALRQSKVDYLQRVDGLAAHPIFWAAFVQLGDNQPVLFAKSSRWWWLALGALVLGVLAWALRRKAKKR